MCRLSFVVPAVLLIMAAPLVADDKADGDLTPLQGEWKVVSAVRRGKELPAEAAAKMTMRFEKDTLTLNDGGHLEVATITLDTSKKIKTFDLTAKKQDQVVTLVQGI